MKKLTLLLVAVLALPAAARAEGDTPPVRPVNTFSIVARDGATGEMGVAVQSHWFDVGSVVPWAEAGVGAVATQSLAEPAYGPRGLDLMRSGMGAQAALSALTGADPGQAVRQVAMIDATGGLAQHTGTSCIATASQAHGSTGDGTVWACQSNMMHRPGVPEAMSTAFENAAGEDLAERLVRALEAAQRAGGDIRGKQSAAILVVSGELGEGWRGRELDLRIADHPAPVKELRRQLELSRAYEHMNAGDRALENNDLAGALAHYHAAQDLNPTNVEMSFWTGVTLAGNGRVDESIPFFQAAFADPARLKDGSDGGSDWVLLLRRLPDSGLFPDDADLIDRIITEASPR